jgi:hypothetical protein
MIASGRLGPYRSVARPAMGMEANVARNVALNAHP